MPNAPSQPRRQAPRRRPTPHPRAATRRRRVPARRLGWRSIAVLSFLGFCVLSVAWAAIARAFAPTGNTAATRFDALIVLGSPADSDGNPKPVMLSRVAEAVREYNRGVAPRMILTGGKDGARYVQATVMERVAEAQGVPASAIFVEPEANDTIHNACLSERIMKAHGWRSAELITSPVHLQRASLIFSRLPIDWRAHAAPSIQPGSSSDRLTVDATEIVKTTRYLLYASWGESCSP